MTAPNTINYKRTIEYLQSINAEYSEHKFGRIRLYLDNATVDYWPTRETVRIKGTFKIDHIKDIKTLIHAQ